VRGKTRTSTSWVRTELALVWLLAGCGATADAPQAGGAQQLPGAANAGITGATPAAGTNPLAGASATGAVVSGQASAASGGAAQLAGAAGVSGAGSMPIAASGNSAGATVAAAGGVGATAGSSALAGAGGSPGPVVPQSYPPLTASQFGTPKVISTKFSLAEGPVWDHCNNRLLFVDVNNRRIHTFVPGGDVGVFMEMTNWSNGLVFDADGKLLMAEMGNGQGGRITRMDMTTKMIEVLIDHDPMGGKLQTSDDLTLRSDGTVYFTDPIISHGTYSNDIGSLATHPFYRIKPGVSGMREIEKLGEGKLPNGIRLTADEKFLYVVGYMDSNIRKFPVNPDGSLGTAAVFAAGLSKPDSMCLDVAGNVYVGVTSGLQVIGADGTMITLIPLASADVKGSPGTTNCAWGGPDGKTMFITAWNTMAQLDNVPIPGLDFETNKRIKCQ
jgi:gluconolactonase